MKIFNKLFFPPKESSDLVECRDELLGEGGQVCLGRALECTQTESHPEGEAGETKCLLKEKLLRVCVQYTFERA